MVLIFFLCFSATLDKWMDTLYHACISKWHIIFKSQDLLIISSYINIYFAMPCICCLDILLNFCVCKFVKQENNYCCRSLSQSRIFCFCSCSVLYSGPARVRNGNVIVFSENKNCIYVESTISENYNENIKMKIK